MKEAKKKKAVSKVESFDKRINVTRDKLGSLEKKRDALVAESVVETLQDSNLTLNDFFEMIDDRDKKEKTADKPAENKEHDFKSNTVFNGGTN